MHHHGQETRSALRETRVMRHNDYGWQGAALYDYLKKQPPGKPITLTELTDLLDTSADRVRQLLAKIRRGDLQLPGRRGPGAQYPALTIDYDQKTHAYYNMSSLSRRAVHERVPASVVNTLVDTIIKRGAHLGEVLEVLSENEEAEEELLSQLPTDKLQDVINVLADITLAQRNIQERIRQREREQGR